MDLLLTVVGEEVRGRISSGALFLMDAMWPQGAADIR